MFIRKKTKKDSKTGKEYHSYQLVESFRTDRGPRQRILMDIGSNLDLNSPDKKLLAYRIEELVTGTQPLFEYPNQVERLAHSFAKLLIQKKTIAIEKKENEKDKPSVKTISKDYQTVDLNSLENEHCRTIGGEHICYQTFLKLNLHKKLLELGFSQSEINLIAATVIARAIHPESERATHFWLKNFSGLDELLNDDFSRLSLNKLYRISDKILKNKTELEQHLRSTERDLFNLEEKIILYDMTNTYFEGLCLKNKKARCGRSKEKRSDCPLVAMGLVIDNNGFPKHSEVFSGNIAESKTFQEMIEALNQSHSEIKPIIIIDAGISSAENLKWLNDNNYSYIVMQKKKHRVLPQFAQRKIVCERVAANYEIDSDQYNLFYKEFISLLAEETDFFSGENNINEQFHQSILDYLAEKCKPGSYDHNLQICVAPPKRIAPPRNLRVSVEPNKTPRLIE